VDIENPPKKRQGRDGFATHFTPTLLADQSFDQPRPTWAAPLATHRKETDVKKLLFAWAVGLALVAASASPATAREVGATPAAVPSTSLATAQEAGATPAVAGPADRHHYHYEVYYWEDDEWVFYDSYESRKEAKKAAAKLRREGYKTRIKKVRDRS
jgi:hypothetical protein